jgi:hypothetical protein
MISAEKYNQSMKRMLAPLISLLGGYEMSLKSRQKCFGSLIILILLMCSGFAATTHAEDPPVYVTQWGMQGTGDGQFNYPIGVAVDNSGNVYVTDESNNRVQKFSSSGTYLSQFGTTGNGDGQLRRPIGITVDSSGNI